MLINLYILELYTQHKEKTNHDVEAHPNPCKVFIATGKTVIQQSVCIMTRFVYRVRRSSTARVNYFLRFPQPVGKSIDNKTTIVCE